MNETFKKAFLICTGIAMLIALLGFLSDSRNQWATAGIILIIAAVIYFFLGLLLIIPKQARKVGQAMLLCSVLILVIGASVCSIAPLNISVR